MTDRFCSSCGGPLGPDTHFCPNCGHPPGASAQPVGTAGTSGQRKRRNRLLYAVALILVAGLAIGITLLLTRSSSQSGELFLESATSAGANPFTDSTTSATGTGAGGTTTTAAPTSAGPTPTEGQTVVGTVDGSTPGLYGGTLNEASCDREKQITFLRANPDKAAAFASVLGIATDQIPDYLRGLTPVVLRHDTRVTNHGFVDGTATSFQSVLQAGTAVLVDQHGIPRVRCMCGNPLTPPTAIEGDVRYRGETWPGFALNQTIVINNNVDIDIFVLVDALTGGWFDRPTGTDGGLDKPHDGGGTTTGGGGTGGGVALCADTYEGAVNRLLGFRRDNDRAGAGVCGSPPVLDYLWGLTDAFAGSLTIDHCEEGNKGLQMPANIQGYACTMSNNAIFVVELVPQGPRNWIVSYVALVDGRTTTTSTPPGAGLGCGSSAESFSPGSPAESTLVSYFKALNNSDYESAWNLLGGELQSEYGSQHAFAKLMAQHVSCVRVLDIKSVGDQEYRLQFAAQYPTPFPAGSGQLPEFWTVSGGRIVSSGTGP